MTRRNAPVLVALFAAVLLFVSAPLAFADGCTGAGQDPPEQPCGGENLDGQTDLLSPDSLTEWTVQAVTLLLQVTAL